MAAAWLGNVAGRAKPEQEVTGTRISVGQDDFDGPAGLTKSRGIFFLAAQGYGTALA